MLGGQPLTDMVSSKQTRSARLWMESPACAARRRMGPTDRRDILAFPWTTPTLLRCLTLPSDSHPMPHRLSKSRFVAGTQRHKLLWWRVHEPLAVELQPDKVLQDRFDQGAHVGTLARGKFPGGVLIDLPHKAVDERVKLTRNLIDDSAPAIFEASFLADNTFVAVDVLAPQDGGYHLTEVKSSSSQKEEHLPDAAVQVHVLSRSDIHITGVDVMHGGGTDIVLMSRRP
jgi:hypothetical protein